MDGPTAAVLAPAIVGVFGTIIVAIIKFVPRRHLNGKGERLATKEQLDVVSKKVDEEEEYTHDTRDELQKQTLKVALLEQLVLTVQSRLHDTINLGDKIDALRSDTKAQSDRQCALLEAALKRTYGQQNP